MAYFLDDEFPRPEFDDFPLRPANSMRPEMCHLIKFHVDDSLHRRLPGTSRAAAAAPSGGNIEAGQCKHEPSSKETDLISI